MIKATERERAVEIGVKALEREARRLGVGLSEVTRDEWEKNASDHGCTEVDDLQAAVGYGRFSARQILQRWAPEQPTADVPAPAAPAAPRQTEDGQNDLVVRVRGVDDVMVYRAKCCNPIRGEPVVGYITRGKGVAVHSTQCPNVVNLMYEAERRIAVEWTRAASESFSVALKVYSEDRPGILNQLTVILTHENVNIRSLEARPDGERGDAAIVEMSVVRDVERKQLVILTSHVHSCPVLPGRLLHMTITPRTRITTPASPSPANQSARRIPHLLVVPQLPDCDKNHWSRQRTDEDYSTSRHHSWPTQSPAAPGDANLTSCRSN